MGGAFVAAENEARIPGTWLGGHLLGLHGMRKAEVESLLGRPEETGYFRHWDLVYWLGPERGFIRIDSEWLIIRFDDEGRVPEYRVARD